MAKDDKDDSIGAGAIVGIFVSCAALVATVYLLVTKSGSDTDTDTDANADTETSSPVLASGNNGTNTNWTQSTLARSQQNDEMYSQAKTAKEIGTNVLARGTAQVNQKIMLSGKPDPSTDNQPNEIKPDFFETVKKMSIKDLKQLKTFLENIDNTNVGIFQEDIDKEIEIVDKQIAEKGKSFFPSFSFGSNPTTSSPNELLEKQGEIQSTNRGVSNIGSINAQMGTSSSLASGNLEERGEKLQSADEKSERMKDNASTFNKYTSQLLAQQKAQVAAQPWNQAMEWYNNRNKKNEPVKSTINEEVPVETHNKEKPVSFFNMFQSRNPKTYTTAVAIPSADIPTSDIDKKGGRRRTRGRKRSRKTRRKGRKQTKRIYIIENMAL